jgi:hypothetical protein
MKKSVRFIGWILIIFILLLGYIYYFLAYVPSREARLFERGFRILQDYSRNIETKENYYLNHLYNFGRYYIMLDESSEDIVASDALLLQLLPDLKKKNDLNSQIHFSWMDGNRGNSTGWFIEAETRNLVYDIDYILDQKADRKNDTLSKLMEEVREIQGNRGGRACFTISPSEFFKGLKYDFVYESILVFDDHGLISSDPDHYNLFNYDTLIHDSRSAYAGLVKKDIMIHNEKKHLLILPCKLLGKDIYLAGIINSSVYVDWTRNLNPELILALIVLITLLFSSFPLFKLLFISKQERLHSNDANLATLSLIFCIGLVVILVQGPFKLNLSKKHKMDDRLDEISQKLCANIKSDLSSVFSIYDQIVNCENDSKTAVEQLMKRMKRGISEHTFPLDSSYFPEINKGKCLLPLPVNDILFIDSTGFSRKMVTKYYKQYKRFDVPDLVDRDYYRVIRESKQPYLWDSIPYFIESIMAYTSGKGEAAISFEHKETFRTIEDTIQTDILAITSSLPSLFNQVLPSDVQFAVIDRTGKTLFHSERNRNLHENFFEEVEKAKLRSFLENNLCKKDWIIYHSRDWRAKIRPIDTHIQLYLITLIDDQQAQEKHTRIVLHTIILFLIYTFFIVLGTTVINFTRPKNLFLKQKQYNYVWLFFTDRKLDEYKQLLITYVILIGAQIAGLFYYELIWELLLFQFTVVSLSAYYGLDSLDQKLYQITVPLRRPGVWMLFGISILFILSLTVLVSTRDDSGASIGLYVPIFILLTSFVFYHKVKNIPLKWATELIEDLNVNPSIFYYRLFMGAWLILMTALPAAHMMTVLEDQEGTLWSRYDLNHMASKNVRLLNNYQPFSNKNLPDWYTQAQGDGLDGYRIDFVSDNPEIDSLLEEKENRFKKSFPSKLLPDIEVNLDPFFMHSACFDTAVFDYDSAIYERVPLMGEWLKVSGDPSKSQMEKINLFGYILLTIVILVALIYLIIVYLLNQLMYIDFGNWIEKNTPDWMTWLKDDEFKKVILVSRNYQRYLPKTTADKKFKIVHLDEPFPTSSEAEKESTYFITGLEWHIYDVSKHSEFLEKVEDFVRNTEHTIVICSPFEFDFIKSVIYQHYGGDRMQEEERKSYLHLLAKWETIFQRFYKYNGELTEIKEDPPEKPTVDYLLNRELAIAPELKATIQSNLDKPLKEVDTLDTRVKRDVEVLILGIQQLLEPKYYTIWNSCTDMEKLVLYDLADDGMVNLKNRFLINRMIANNLILHTPYPKIFSESFRNFILTSVREEEIKEIEKVVRRGGSWNNIRFFLLTIFLAIAIFLVVIQGTSIDRAMAIITSVLAFIPALIRLLNNLYSPRESRVASPRSVKQSGGS